jgi:hypothetical protein
MDELVKAFPIVWCPNCRRVQPMVFIPMKANEHNAHDAADIMRRMSVVVATLYAGK